MLEEELAKILKLHKAYLRGDPDGVYAYLSEANLSGANLSEANLRGANLREADLSEANLRGADLRGANLRWANLRGANLREADLIEANLSGANLREANLRGADLSEADLREANLREANLREASLRGADLSEANLRGANLSWADLRGADLSGADLPAVTMLLSCQWGSVSSELTVELMRYDASNHANPTLFDEWAKGGICPYSQGLARPICFKEERTLWSPSNPKTARELVLMLFTEKKINYSEGI